VHRVSRDGVRAVPRPDRGRGRRERRASPRAASRAVRRAGHLALHDPGERHRAGLQRGSRDPPRRAVPPRARVPGVRGDRRQRRIPRPDARASRARVPADPARGVLPAGAGLRAGAGHLPERRRPAVDGRGQGKRREGRRPQLRHQPGSVSVPLLRGRRHRLRPRRSAQGHAARRPGPGDGPRGDEPRGHQPAARGRGCRGARPGEARPEPAHQLPAPRLPPSLLQQPTGLEPMGVHALCRGRLRHLAPRCGARPRGVLAGLHLRGHRVDLPGPRAAPPRAAALSGPLPPRHRGHHRGAGPGEPPGQPARTMAARHHRDRLALSAHAPEPPLPDGGAPRGPLLRRRGGPGADLRGPLARVDPAGMGSGRARVARVRPAVRDHCVRTGSSPRWRSAFRTPGVTSNWRNPPRPAAKSAGGSPPYNQRSWEVGGRREGGGGARRSDEAG